MKCAKIVILSCFFGIISLNILLAESHGDSVLDDLIDDLCCFRFKKEYELSPKYLSVIVRLSDHPKIKPYKSLIDYLVLFHLHDSKDYEYARVGDTFYVKFPKIFKKSLRDILSREIEKTYKKVSHKLEGIDIAPPEGFIYVWFFKEIGEMQRFFNMDERTGAFAIGCRFIIVPYSFISDRRSAEIIFGGSPNTVGEEKARLTQRIRERFAESFSHELVHVYINSSVGFRNKNNLPEWFHEGLAVTLSGQDRKSVTPEYRRYASIFDFIRLRYGRERYKSFIRSSIEDASVKESLERLGIESEKELFKKTGNWLLLQRWISVFLIGVVAVVGVILLKRWWGGSRI